MKNTYWLNVCHSEGHWFPKKNYCYRSVHQHVLQKWFLTGLICLHSVSCWEAVAWTQVTEASSAEHTARTTRAKLPSIPLRKNREERKFTEAVKTNKWATDRAPFCHGNPFCETTRIGMLCLKITSSCVTSLFALMDQLIHWETVREVQNET